jgi:hypothetical protein
MITDNFRKTTARIAALSIIVAAIMLVPFSSTASASAAINPTADISDECKDQISKQMHEKAALTDDEKAKTLASSQKEFQEKNVGKDTRFANISHTWSFDKNCNVTLVASTLTYYTYNGASIEKVTTVVVDPQITKTLSMTEEEPKYHSTSTNWAGYTMRGASAAGTVPVYEAKAAWSTPAASAPWTNACQFVHCDVSVWPGLTDNAIGSHIAQAGTDSGYSCIGFCANFYSAWWEFYPDPSNTCGSFTIGSGDSITTDVWSNGKSGGTVSQYNISIVDSTSGSSCSVSNHSFTALGTPYYAQYIDERPSFGGTAARLPSFADHNITGWIYYSGSLNTIYTPYNNGWKDKVTMINGGNTNIDPGAVNTSGVFLQDYKTSNGT